MEWFSKSLWILLFITVPQECIGSGMTDGDVEDYCEKETFHAHCSNGVIFMSHARYGRMKLGTCLKHDFGFMDCFSDVLPSMDSRCSGRESCNGLVTSFVSLIEPCPPELRSYLEVSYSCIEVTSSNGRCCHSTEHHATIEAGHGYLAGSQSLTTGCGSIDCPWKIQAAMGQKIIIYVYDFGYGNQYATDMGEPNDGQPCDAYGVLTEEAVGVTLSICPGSERKRILYTSSTSSVDIYTNQEKLVDDVPSFVIEFEAFGCTDPTPPEHGFVKMERGRVVIGCLGAEDRTWEITCQHGQWHGITRNCSVRGSATDEEHNVPGNKITLNFNLALVLIIGVAVIISLAVLCVGVLCILRRRKPRPSANKERALAHPMMERYLFQSAIPGENKGSEDYKADPIDIFNRYHNYCPEENHNKS